MVGNARTLGAMLRDSAAAYGAASALVFPDTRQTHGELNASARAWAKALIGMGVQPGEHVGILLSTRPEFVEILFGIAMAGATAVPVNARYQPGELSYLVKDADLVAMITTGKVAEGLDFAQRLHKALPGLAGASVPKQLALDEAPKLRQVVCIDDPCSDGLISGADALAMGNGVEDAELDARIDAVDPDSIGLILYTSGTTANPKGCLIRHRGIVGNSRNLAHRYRMEPGDSFWSPLPIFHIAGILPMVAVLDLGGSYLTIPVFDAGVAIDMLEKERATHAYPCFVTIIADIIDHPRFEEADLSSVRVMNSNFAVQPPRLRDAVAEKMPDAVQVGTYGLTEGSGTICTSRPEDPYELRVGRLGVPLPEWEVKIVDPETGEERPTGAKGEIIARGPNMLAGYYNAPDKTAEAIRDGWLWTGDLGSFDENGHIMFHGRTKDMLKVGGENVAAAEIEAVLQDHPAVKLAQVVGKSDERYVEVPAAFIELQEGASAEETELIDFCKGKLASFKIPRLVRFVDEWPMSTSKIQKFKLRDALEKEPA